MEGLSRRRLLGELGAAGAMLMVGGSGFALAQASVVLQIVTARANAIRDISLTELRQLYRGRRILVGGIRAIPFNHPAGTFDRVGFDRILFGMTPDEVGRFWVDQKIRGGDAPPRTIDSVSLLLRVVAGLQGALGYVRAGFLSPELKVVSIEGRLPGDRAYPLVV